MQKTKICKISNTSHDVRTMVVGKDLRPHIFDLIKSEHADFSEKSFICMEELNKYRKKYLEAMVQDEMGELSKIEKEVMKSIHDNELLSTNIEDCIDYKLTIGEAVADKVAEFGGSWIFIISFFAVLIVWILINSFIILAKTFDPYPFILLNLVLSCLAAIQAPIIMMSQNRKEAKDRRRSENDYRTNLKAELEIRLLHEKVDHLLLQQNSRFMEIQQIQVDLMEDILNRLKEK